jgi:hypothetical protein
MRHNIRQFRKREKSSIAPGGGGASGEMLTIGKTSTFRTSNQPEKAKPKPNNQLVIIDWADLKLKDSFSDKLHFTPTANNIGWLRIGEANGIYSLEMLYSGGSSYRKAADIHYMPDGCEETIHKIGTLYWDGMFADIKGTAKLHIEKKLFYQKLGSVITFDIIHNFTLLLGSEIIGLIRLDIAFDSTKYADIANKVANGTVTPLKQDSLKPIHTKMEYGQRKELGFNFGSREYGRYIRVYNKTEELSQSKNKVSAEYIRQFWSHNGLNDSKKNVFRIEFELRQNYLKKIDSLDYKDIFNPDKLLEIAEVAARNYFEFVPTSVLDRRVKNYTQDRREAAQKRLYRAKEAGQCVKIIDWKKVKTDCYVIAQAQPTPKTSTRTAALTVKQLALSAAFTSIHEPEKAADFIRAAANIMHENALETYVSKRGFMWGQSISREALRKGVALNPVIDIQNVAVSLQSYLETKDQVKAYNPVIAPKPFTDTKDEDFEPIESTFLVYINADVYQKLEETNKLKSVNYILHRAISEDLAASLTQVKI